MTQRSAYVSKLLTSSFYFQTFEYLLHAKYYIGPENEETNRNIPWARTHSTVSQKPLLKQTKSGNRPNYIHSLKHYHFITAEKRWIIQQIVLEQSVNDLKEKVGFHLIPFTNINTSWIKKTWESFKNMISGMRGT